MKILVATNYFKGSLSAVQAAETIKNTILEVNPHYKVVAMPVADGGDGTLEAIKTSANATEMTTEVCDPLCRSVKAKWLYIENTKTAIIEASQANGLSLLRLEEYNPLKTTTYGVGELIKAALDKGAKEIILAIGGSATNDAGAGILQALGGILLDNNNKELSQGGGALGNVSSIDLSALDKHVADTKISVACDVDNPLCGKNGASYVYAPQKGATPEMIEILDKNLSHFAQISSQITGKDYKNLPGTGAAGGIGFAIKTFLDGKLVPGFELIEKICGLEAKMQDANLVITTEGRFDSQTLSGKAPHKVAQMAKKYKIPVIMIAGAIERNLNYEDTGITAAFSLADGPIALEDAIKNAPYLLKKMTKNLFSILFRLK